MFYYVVREFELKRRIKLGVGVSCVVHVDSCGLRRGDRIRSRPASGEGREVGYFYYYYYYSMLLLLVFVLLVIVLALMFMF